MTFSLFLVTAQGEEVLGEFGEGSVDLLPRIEDGENVIRPRDLRIPGLVDLRVETSPRWRRGSRDIVAKKEPWVVGIMITSGV